METTTYNVASAEPPHIETRVERFSNNYISWGAILAGVFIALSVATVLNLLGLGLDLIAFTPDKETMTDITILSIIWITLTSIISMLAGGWVAGRMSGPAYASEGALHGLVMCAVTILLTFILATSLGTIVGVMSTVIAQSFSFAEQANAHTTSPLANTTAATSLTPENQTLLQHDVQDFFSADNPKDEATARTNLTNFLEQNLGMTTTDAEQTVNNWQKAKQNAIENAEAASKGLGILVLILFVSFLLSAVASAFGGVWGVYSDRELFIRKRVVVKKV